MNEIKRNYKAVRHILFFVCLSSAIALQAQGRLQQKKDALLRLISTEEGEKSFQHQKDSLYHFG